MQSGSNSVAQRAGLGGRRAQPLLVLGVILAVQLMVVLDTTIVNIALPDIQRALGFSSASLSWVVNAYTLAFGGLMLLGARAGDLVGRRRTFIAGIAIFTAGSLAGGMAVSSAWLLAARAAQGAGGALATPSALALLMTMFPEPRARTRALGWYTGVSIGGAAVGLVAGGLLTQWASWRWVFFVNVPIGLAVLAAARVLLVETPRRSGRFDLVGALTSTAGVTALVYAFVRVASDGWSDPVAAASFVSGAALLAAFVAAERRAAEPITPLRLFASRDRISGYAARLLLMAGVLGMFFFLTQVLQNVLGYSPLRAGLAFVPMTVALFASSQLSARLLMERFGEKAVALSGIGLSTLGLVWLTQLSATSGYAAMLGPVLLCGAGNGVAFVPLTSLALSGVAPRDAGAASGLVNVMQQLGGALGLSVLVSIFGGAARGAGRGSASFVAGADHAFTTSAIFLAATLVVVALVARGRSRPAGVRVAEPVAGERERRLVDEAAAA